MALSGHLACTYVYAVYARRCSTVVDVCLHSMLGSMLVKCINVHRMASLDSIMVCCVVSYALHTLARAGGVRVSVIAVCVSTTSSERRA